MNKHTTIFIFLLLTAYHPLHAFLPYVKNYTRDVYAASGQNWMLQSDAANTIYIGNHNGLLEFDGCNWTLHPLKSKNIVRSLLVSPEGHIYVGSNQEFGFFTRNTYGELIYTSLSENLDPGLLHNKQIWSIVQKDEKIYFQSFGGY
ncbi:hypothetical protein [Bacteroides sp. 51]|uniref:hypothetical protein n=1 Tax=Bacteroides sp. 51 TaxID=2302938 RepID=UPI0013D2C1F1|nr:hypothetical protein [Bacteroides sp. 51]NDV83874.1 hypothetical protein [Bacteroides sp. 51]